MGLPHRLAAKPRAWRGNPLWIPVQCWQDTAKTLPVDLTTLAPNWQAQYGLDGQSPTTAFDTVDTTQLATGRITVKLSDTTTAGLTGVVYRFEIVAVGGAITPVTVFTGLFTVDGP